MTSSSTSKPTGSVESPLTTGGACGDVDDPTPPLSKQEKCSLNIGAAVLQLVGTPIFLVGWIWSINWGIVMVFLASELLTLLHLVLN